MKTILLFGVLIIMIFAPSRSVSQISCSNDITHVSLSSLFAAVSIPASAEFTKEKKLCTYLYEGNAYDLIKYNFCSNWMAQKKLESLDNSVLASFIRIHDKAASIGSGKLGLENRFTYTDLNTSNGRLGGRERLAIKLFGKKLKLIPHNFNIDFEPPTVPGKTSKALWESSNFSFEVVVPIPLPAGTFELGLSSSYRDRNNGIGNRSATYSFINTFSGVDTGIKGDWLNYPEGGITQTNFRNKLHLSNEYELTIYSPWVGADIGLASAKMRLSLSANIKGELMFNENYNFDEPYMKGNCPSLYLQYFQEHTLGAKLSGEGKINVRIKVPFKTIRKEFTVISTSPVEGNSDFSYNGLNVEVPISISSCQLAPCSPTQPFIDSVFPVFSAVPEPDTDNAPLDPTEWAQEVTDEVSATYYICDRNKKLWAAENDKMIKSLSEQLKSNRISQAEADKRLYQYLKDNIFLCERTCADICIIKADDTHFETKEELKRYLEETN